MASGSTRFCDLESELNGLEVLLNPQDLVPGGLLGPIHQHGSFRKLGVPYFGVLRIRILLFRVLYEGPLCSEAPT